MDILGGEILTIILAAISSGSSCIDPVFTSMTIQRPRKLHGRQAGRQPEYGLYSEVALAKNYETYYRSARVQLSKKFF